MNRLPVVPTLVIVLAALLGACSQKPADGPPVVRYGQDECIHCGMILTDERHVAALRLSEGSETRDVLFDDIGDMLEYEREQAGLNIVRRYVHDFETRQWVDAGSAHFIVSKTIHTPMGSGIVAFSDQARAQAKQKTDGGPLGSLAEVTASLAASAQTAAADAEAAPCCEKDNQ